MSRRHLIVLSGMAIMLAGCQASGDPQVQARNHEFGCIAGTVGGAIVGGLVGSTIGEGRGQTLALAAGLGGGSYLGSQLACR